MGNPGKCGPSDNSATPLVTQVTPFHHGRMPTTTEHSTGRKADIARGFDLVADSFDTVHGTFVNATGARLVQHAGLHPGDRVLDLGCGRGAVLLAAADAVGPDGYVAGIDLSTEMVRATAIEIGHRGLRNVVVRVGDAEDPGYPAGSFEAVLAGLMMFITPDPAAALTAARRLLTPGGRFAMTTYGPADPAWGSALRAALAFREPPVEVTAAEIGASKGGNGLLDTPEDIATLLTASGFTEVVSVDEESVSRLDDPGDWWDSLWSTGRRAALEQIPRPRREDARNAALGELGPVTEGGVLTRRTTVRFTTARRA